MATLRDFTPAVRTQAVASFIKWSRLSISSTVSYLLYSLLNAHIPSCLPFTKRFLKFQLIKVNNIFSRNCRSSGKFLGISFKKKSKQVPFSLKLLLIQTKIRVRLLLAVMNWVISGQFWSEWSPRALISMKLLTFLYVFTRHAKRQITHESWED